MNHYTSERSKMRGQIVADLIHAYGDRHCPSTILDDAKMMEAWVYGEPWEPWTPEQSGGDAPQAEAKPALVGDAWPFQTVRIDAPDTEPDPYWSSAMERQPQDGIVVGTHPAGGMRPSRIEWVSASVAEARFPPLEGSFTLRVIGKGADPWVVGLVYDPLSDQRDPGDETDGGRRA